MTSNDWRSGSDGARRQRMPAAATTAIMVRLSISTPAPVAFCPNSGVVASSTIASAAASRRRVSAKAIQPVRLMQADAKTRFRKNAFATR